ncbi:hypothetical protein DNV98_23900 [Salmonella enterica subsp. enterica serovar Enteritidis]|nr:hypothetical protein [Salmonella enterica subsp. enterica serovar Enteritidis]
MTIRTFDAEPIGTVPGATLFQLNEQRAEEGELCFTADYKKIKEDYEEMVGIIYIYIVLLTMLTSASYRTTYT